MVFYLDREKGCFSYEPGYEPGVWGFIDFGRSPYLSYKAVFHDNHPVGKAHGLNPVMGDIDSGDAQGFLDFPDFDTHLLAKQCIEV